MQSEHFSLATNAFRMLGATYSTTPTEIANLVDDGGYSGDISEEVLHKAQQELITPRLRMTAELAWLPELSAAQAASVLGPQSKLNTSAMLSKVSLLPELARANILADYASSNVIDPDFAIALFDAWQALTPDDILEFLRETRRAAGQPVPDEKLVLSGLQELRSKHAGSLISGLTRGASPAASIKEVIAHELRKGDTDPLLGMMVREYERRSERDTARISDAIGEVLRSIRSGGDAISPFVVTLSEQLDKWLIFTKPLQGFYEWRGHPEPRSKAIFNSVREVALWLANERELHSASSQLSAVLADKFAGLEELRRVAAKDVEDLKGIIAELKEVERFQPLYEATENAKASPAEFARVSEISGMRKEATAPVGPFVLAVARFLEDGGNVDMAAAVARELSLSFNNDADRPDVAYLVLDYMDRLARPRMSAQTMQNYDEDLATIFRNWKFPQLEKHKGNIPELIAALEIIVESAPASVKPEFAAFLTGLKGKQRAKRIKWLVWATIVGFVIIVSIASNSEKRSSYGSSSYGTSGGSSRYSTETRNYGSSGNSSYTPAPKPTPVQPVDLKLETKPSFGSGKTLSRNEIRYCIFQGKRLDLLRDVPTTNAQVAKFNAMVGDFNNRCESYRYMQVDMTAVQSEAALRTSAFLEETSTIARNW
ncbi:MULTISPECIES: hypothetical protein [unclassified Rhizobium]|uniref:hypothetical protein n=1 Tax=unclassified Rhizobium TaxID=2613769 RepID=UPI00288C3E48|nr:MULTISPECIES: hypothetical protein [unclassified Rhizobium]